MLKPFDETAKCPKCQGADISAQYNDGSHLFCPLRYPESHEEHIDRRCCRCGFRWAEGLAVPLALQDVSEAAKVLARRGSSAGGQARAAKLTPERRREIALKAVNARWAKR